MVGENGDFKPTKLKLFEKLSDATEASGVLIDYKLSWKNRVDSIALKISKTIGLLSKLRHFVPHHTLVNIYNSLITHYLHYGLTELGQAGKTYLNKLLILQKRALRLIYLSDRRDHAIPFILECSYFTYKFYALQITSRNNAWRK